MKFEFFTEDGVFKMEYADYCKAPEMMNRIANEDRVLVNLGLRILTFDKQWLAEHKQQRLFVEQMERERAENPLRFFLPHCANSNDFNTPSHHYINDDEHLLTVFLSGNRYGKTTLTWIRIMTTFSLVQCDKNWEIFKDHGVNYHAFTQPKDVGLVSYHWDNHRKTIWPKVIKIWTPKSELGEWAQWEVPQVTTGQIVDLKKSLSNIHLMACSQPQAMFESTVLDLADWDEQGTENRFDGLNARLKTRRLFYPDENGIEKIRRGSHSMGLTPHRLQDRPDSGADSWIYKLATKQMTKGLSIKFYHGDLHADVPDWIYPERQKQVDQAELQEAIERKDKKRDRQIRARIYGEWESTGGLVYDEFDEEVHVIDDMPINPKWCALRAGDHGRTNPSAWLWIAITPQGDWIVFREYLEGDLTISTCVENVVRLSGNILRDRQATTFGQMIMTEREEVQSNEEYILDVMDGRSFRKPDNNTPMTIGQLYQKAGMRKIRPAPLQLNKGTIEMVKEMMKIRHEVKHIQTGSLGAPRLYIFRSCRLLINHIKNYRNLPVIKDGRSPSEKPQEVDDHDLDALRYAVMSAPSYKAFKTIKPNGGTNETQGKGKGYWVKNGRSGSARGNGRTRRDPYTARKI